MLQAASLALDVPSGDNEMMPGVLIENSLSVRVLL